MAIARHCHASPSSTIKLTAKEACAGRHAALRSVERTSSSCRRCTEWKVRKNAVRVGTLASLLELVAAQRSNTHSAISCRTRHSSGTHCRQSAPVAVRRATIRRNAQPRRPAAPSQRGYHRAMMVLVVARLQAHAGNETCTRNKRAHAKAETVNVALIRRCAHSGRVLHGKHSVCLLHANTLAGGLVLLGVRTASSPATSHRS